MKAAVVKMTPKLAQELLDKNKKNRAISERKLKEYMEAMEAGQWKENGESVIQDTEGALKDGQHRLHAVVKTGKTYDMVLVTDVEPQVMDTIDVGKNRSLADMLKIEGAKHTSITAAIIKNIISYNNNQYATTGLVTNVRGMSFFYDKKEEIVKLARHATKLYQKQTYKILGSGTIGYYHYVLAGFTPNDKTSDFLLNVMGVNNKEGTASTWFYKKMYEAKKDKVRLHPKWKLGVMIKAWNQYVDGDPPIRNMSYEITKPLPKPHKLPETKPVQISKV